MKLFRRYTRSANSSPDPAKSYQLFGFLAIVLSSQIAFGGFALAGTCLERNNESVDLELHQVYRNGKLKLRLDEFSDTDSEDAVGPKSVVISSNSSIFSGKHQTEEWSKDTRLSSKDNKLCDGAEISMSCQFFHLAARCLFSEF